MAEETKKDKVVDSPSKYQKEINDILEGIKKGVELEKEQKKIRDRGEDRIARTEAQEESRKKKGEEKVESIADSLLEKETKEVEEKEKVSEEEKKRVLKEAHKRKLLKEKGLMTIEDYAKSLNMEESDVMLGVEKGEIPVEQNDLTGEVFVNVRAIGDSLGGIVA